MTTQTTPRRRRRWLLRVLIAVAAAVVGVWLGLAFLLPAIVRQQVTNVLRNAGFEQVKFELRNASLWRTHLTGIAATNDDRLSVGTVTVHYRPLEVLNGHLRYVHVWDARASIALDTLQPTSQPAAKAPEPVVQHVEVQRCVLSLHGNGMNIELPFDATLTRVPVGAGSLSIRDASLVSKGDVEAEVRGVYASLALASLQPPRTEPGQWLSAGSVKLAGQEFTNVVIAFEVKSHEQIEVAHARLTWSGGTLRAEPFTVAPAAGGAELAINIEKIELEKLLAIITRGKATGSGTLSGRLPMYVGGGSTVTLWPGKVESDGPGTLRLGDSVSMLAKVLDQTDGRFTSDPQMRQVKEQILEAMTDFQYEKITAEMSRREGQLVVAVRIQGQGRTGAKQPLDVTLNFRGLEEGLNTYLAVSSRVFKIAGGR